MSTKAPTERPRILVPRAPERAAALVAALDAVGLDAHVAPALKLLRLTPTLPESVPQWVFFTSATALEHATSLRRWFETDSPPQVLAIGDKTAAAVRARGWPVDLVPEVARAEGALAAFTAGGRPPTSVVIARAAHARPVLERGLRAAGHAVSIVALYGAAPLDEGERARLRAGLTSSVGIALLSGTMARNVRDAVGDQALRTVHLYSIGPVTSDAIRALGHEVAAEAARADIDALAAAAAAHLASR